MIEDGVVVVEGNRIARRRPRGEVAIPAGAKTIDVAGKTIMPGLIDVHSHGALGLGRHHPAAELGRPTPSLALRRDHGPRSVERHRRDLRRRRAARAGMIVAPRIFSTGTILYGAAGDFKAEIDIARRRALAPAPHEGGRRHLA